MQISPLADPLPAASLSGYDMLGLIVEFTVKRISPTPDPTLIRSLPKSQVLSTAINFLQPKGLNARPMGPLFSSDRERLSRDEALKRIGRYTTWRAGHNRLTITLDDQERIADPVRCVRSVMRELVALKGGTIEWAAATEADSHAIRIILAEGMRHDGFLMMLRITANDKEMLNSLVMAFVEAAESPTTPTLLPATPEREELDLRSLLRQAERLQRSA